MARREHRTVGDLRRWFVALLAGFGLMLVMDVGAEQDEYVVGIFPYFAPTRLEALYAPIASDLAALTKKPVRLRTALSFDSFFERLGEQDYDLALVQPFYHVAAVDKFGYLPLVHADQGFRSVVVVKADSGIRTGLDLRGKMIATPPVHVPAVQLARQTMRELGLELDKDVQFRAMPSADSCLQQVLNDGADACITGPLGASTFAARSNIQFHTVIETMALPNLSFVVHPRVDDELRQRWRDFLLGLAASDDGRAILQRIQVGSFVSTESGDYDVVREFIGRMEEPWHP